MWMNSANRVEQSEAVSPLSHDIKGSFSRKGKPIDQDKKDPQWLDSLLVVLFIFSLFAMDLLAFAGSGYMNVFEKSVLPIPEILLIFLWIFGVASIVIFMFHKNRVAKYICASLSAILIAYVISRQFFQYNQDFMVGNYPLPVAMIISLMFGGLTFVVFYQKDRVLYRVLYVVIFLVLFINTYFTHYLMGHNEDFETIYNTQQQVQQKSKRIIYFMLPNFASYSYISKIGNEEAVKTQEIMQGFYQKNKFTVYDRAYTPEPNYTGNIIRSVNPTINKISSAHRMDTKMLDSYWRLHNLRTEYIFLQNNELYDLMQNGGFQVSAYKSRDIDICRKQHKFNVNRCVEKVNKPIDLYHTTLSVFDRSKILAVEWLASMQLSKDLSFAYNFVGLFVDPNDLDNSKIDFNGLYVVNSLKTFDVLLNNIKQDSGRQIYIVFVDLPSNMYVYNEYCQLKHPSKWVSMTSMPWIAQDYKTERQNAYLQQTRCLFGKFEQFMENLRQERVLDDSIIIIQGVSSANDFAPFTSDASADKFISSRMVNMAIYDEKSDRFRVDDRFCATTQIVTEYLYPNRKCGEDITGYHQKIIDNINSDLTVLNKGMKNYTIDIFDRWYQEWDKVNQEAMKNSVIQIEEPEKPEETKKEPEQTPKAEEQSKENMELNSGVFDDIGDLFDQEQ